MDKKVVFLDVDGTLVNEKGEIPKTAQYAIQKAKENYEQFVIYSSDENLKRNIQNKIENLRKKLPGEVLQEESVIEEVDESLEESSVNTEQEEGISE